MSVVVLPSVSFFFSIVCIIFFFLVPPNFFKFLVCFLFFVGCSVFLILFSLLLHTVCLVLFSFLVFFFFFFFNFVGPARHFPPNNLRAHARLFLVRLASFERRILFLFCQSEGNKYTRSFSLLHFLTVTTMSWRKKIKLFSLSFRRDESPSPCVCVYCVP